MRTPDSTLGCSPTDVDGDTPWSTSASMSKSMLPPVTTQTTLPAYGKPRDSKRTENEWLEELFPNFDTDRDWNLPMEECCDELIE